MTQPGYIYTDKSERFINKITRINLLNLRLYSALYTPQLCGSDSSEIPSSSMCVALHTILAENHISPVFQYGEFMGFFSLSAANI